MILQRLIGKIYFVFVEIMLWVLPVMGAITGYFAIGSYSGGESSGHYLLGIIGGVIVGLFLDAILFGPIILLFSIKASLRKMEKK